MTTKNRSRPVLTLLAILVLLLLLMPQFAFPMLHGASAQLSSNQSAPPVYLGFSPSTMSPLSLGTPVYSVNDTLWILETTNASASVQLFAPSGEDKSPPNVLVVSTTVAPNITSQLHTFRAGDNDGTWLLSITFNFFNPQTFNFQLPFVNSAVHPLASRLASYSLQAGHLLGTFQLNASGAFSPPLNAQGCLLSGGAGTANVAAVPIPAGLGSGSIAISGFNPQGSPVALSAPATIANPFDFWFELRTPYSYAASNSSGLTTRNVTVAISGTATFGPSGSATNESVAMSGVSSLRPGRYWVSAFFDSAGGLVLEQVPVALFGGDDLFSLAPTCGTLLSFSGDTLSTSSSLLGSPSQWPSTLLVMAEWRGVEAQATVPLGLGLGRISNVASPWGGVPADIGIVSVQSTFSSSSSSPAACPAESREVTLSSAYNDSLFFTASRFPALVRYCLTFGGKVFSTQQVIVTQPYTALTSDVALARIRVQVTNNGKPVSGATVSVDNTGLGGAENKTSSTSGALTYLVPAGGYLVTATYSSATQSQSFSLQSGQDQPITFAFSIPSGGNQNVAPPAQTLAPYLVAAAVIGIIANLWAWLLRPRIALRKLLRQ